MDGKPAGGNLMKRLEALMAAFRAGKAQDLKRLGNISIERAVEGGDTNLAQLSVISYALYKILSKDHFVKSKKWEAIARSINSSLAKAQGALQKDKIPEFSQSIENTAKSIREIDDELSNYAQGIYSKARIKQASTAYASGLSLNRAAELTGADSRELQRYIGFTRIHDELPPSVGISGRMKMLKGMLGK